MTAPSNQHRAFPLAFLLQKTCFNKIQNEQSPTSKGHVSEPENEAMGLLGLSVSTHSFSDRLNSYHHQKRKSLPVNCSYWKHSPEQKVIQVKRKREVWWKSYFSFSGLSSAPAEEGFYLLVTLLDVCRSSECFQGLGISAKNPFWQSVCSFNICKLLKKLRIETKKKIRSSAVTWHSILSLFLMTCPLTFFYNVSDFSN